MHWSALLSLIHPHPQRANRRHWYAPDVVAKGHEGGPMGGGRSGRVRRSSRGWSCVTRAGGVRRLERRRRKPTREASISTCRSKSHSLQIGVAQWRGMHGNLRANGARSSADQADITSALVHTGSTIARINSTRDCEAAGSPRSSRQPRSTVLRSAALVCGAAASRSRRSHSSPKTSTHRIPASPTSPQCPAHPPALWHRARRPRTRPIPSPTHRRGETKAQIRGTSWGWGWCGLLQTRSCWRRRWRPRDQCGWRSRGRAWAGASAVGCVADLAGAWSGAVGGGEANVEVGRQRGRWCGVGRGR